MTPKKDKSQSEKPGITVTVCQSEPFQCVLSKETLLELYVKVTLFGPDRGETESDEEWEARQRLN